MVEVVFKVTPYGIAAPDYDTILTELQAQMRAIYGNDIYLGNDSQDGQLLAIFARALHDANASAISVYNAFSPATAQGTGLSSVVKINGISRLVPSHSTVDLTLIGQAGTEIFRGIAADDVNDWQLPEEVLIPVTGEIVVTATAVLPGDLIAEPGTITKIRTPMLGWQTVTNETAAIPGAPVETDAELRRRQTVSTMLPSRSVLEGIKGGVANLKGVIEVAAYENDTGTTNADTLPPHSISLVVLGGVVKDIATTIFNKKTAGCYTYGNVEYTVTPVGGVPCDIRFYRPTSVPIKIRITLTPLAGYANSVGNAIRYAVAEYVTSLMIGDDVLHSRLYTPGNLSGNLSAQVAAAAGISNPGTLTTTYDIDTIELARGAGAFAMTNIILSFREMATMKYTDVEIVVS